MSESEPSNYFVCSCSNLLLFVTSKNQLHIIEPCPVCLTKAVRDREAIFNRNTEDRYDRGYKEGRKGALKGCTLEEVKTNPLYQEVKQIGYQRGLREGQEIQNKNEKQSDIIKFYNDIEKTKNYDTGYSKGYKQGVTDGEERVKNLKEIVNHSEEIKEVKKESYSNGHREGYNNASEAIINYAKTYIS